MGCLDPKMDPARTFELLRKRDAIRAELKFNGGHDEGWVESITLTLSTGEETDLIVWYCGGYGMEKDEATGEYRWLPMSTPANEDEELSDLLQGPIDEQFGSWGSVPSTNGTLVWDVFKEKAELRYSQETYASFSDEVMFS